MRPVEFTCYVRGPVDESCLSGMDRRLKESRHGREWMNSPKLHCFLNEACNFLNSEFADKTLDGERVMHYLMGLIESDQLPEKLRAHAGSWRDRGMAATLKDLIRTNRWRHAESFQKSCKKVELLQSEVSLNVRSRASGLVFMDDPESIAALLESPYLPSDDAEAFLREYLRDEDLTCYGDKRVMDALYNGLTRGSFTNVDKILLEHFDASPVEFNFNARARKLLGAWLSVAPTIASSNSISLKPWFGRFFPENEKTPCYLDGFKGKFMNAIGSWPASPIKGMEAQVFTEKRFQEVKDMLLRSPPQQMHGWRAV